MPASRAVGSSPRCSNSASTRLVASFACWTLGWSNGLICRPHPATATAISHSRKTRPRSAGPCVGTVITGWPSRASAPVPASSAASGLPASGRYANTRSSAYVPGAPSGSSATGRMPRPRLPVDSATSCSSHRPRPGSESAITNVSLSRPRRASSESANPSGTPALALPPPARAPLAAVSHARRAPSSSPRTSTPMSAAGTMPKADSAL